MKCSIEYKGCRQFYLMVNTYSYICSGSSHSADFDNNFYFSHMSSYGSPPPNGLQLQAGFSPNLMQLELERIAEQASNLPYGTGVILRKLYESLKEKAVSMSNYCSQLSSQFVGITSQIKGCQESAATMQRMTDCVDITLHLDEAAIPAQELKDLQSEQKNLCRPFCKS